MATPEQRLDWFFKNWCRQYRVVTTVEGGMIFEQARRNWVTMRYVASANQERAERLQRDMEYHRDKHFQWLTAYQEERCKSVGDYTRMFVRRPRMRRLVLFLTRL